MATAELEFDAVPPIPNSARAAVEYSGYEARLAVAALEGRQSNLEKLAKKTEDEGYPKEARIIRGDAQVIADHILPQLRPQVELPLPSPAECRAGIAEALRGLLHGKLEHEFTAGRQAAMVDDGDRIDAKPRVDLEVLLGELAERLERFGRSVADRAYAAGHAAREQTAEAAMVRSLDELRPLGPS